MHYWLICCPPTYCVTLPEEQNEMNKRTNSGSLFGRCASRAQRSERDRTSAQCIFQADTRKYQLNAFRIDTNSIHINEADPKNTKIPKWGTDRKSEEHEYSLAVLESIMHYLVLFCTCTGWPAGAWYDGRASETSSATRLRTCAPHYPKSTINTNCISLEKWFKQKKCEARSHGLCRYIYKNWNKCIAKYVDVFVASLTLAHVQNIESGVTGQAPKNWTGRISLGNISSQIKWY